jgi:RNA polymerase sigma factor (sigma-70 family)
MQERDDMALLREYAANNSEAAFAELVSRRVSFVYSAALRQVRDPHQAEEVTQAVFIILAQKAGRLRDGISVLGWLFKTTRFTALAQGRAAAKRQRREQEAHMQSITEEPSAPDLLWEQLSPLLDEALAKLGETDRQAVLLRFFENKSLAEVGSALGTGEDTARKRVSRALDKLRKHFSKRGVASTAAIIAGAISANSVHAAPAVLVNSVTAVAIGKGAAAGGSVLTLINGALKIMAWTKAKTVIVVGVALALVVGTAATGPLWKKEAKADFNGFEVEGTIVYEAFFPQGSGSFKDMKHFIVASDGGAWKIHTTGGKQESTVPRDAPEASVDLYYEMGFDGTNLFTLKQQDGRKVLPNLTADTLRSGRYVLAEGRVEKADSPPCMDTFQICPLWLAYCSAPYFAGLKGDLALSPLFPSRDFLTEAIPPRKQLPAKWNMSGTTFIKDVSWYSDGNVESLGPDGKMTISKYRAPYDTAFLQGQFENIGWTNFNGVSLPSSFKLVVYRPDYASRDVANFKVAYTITGTLEQVRKLSEFSPTPKLTTRTIITDSRIMRGGRPTSYASTNRWDYADAIR